MANTTKMILLNEETNIEPYEIEDIKQKIYTIRGKQVILDSDIAKLYEVETRVVNQAVKRNIERFPDEFCFQLKKEEYSSLKSQIVISKGGRRKILMYLQNKELLCYQLFYIVQRLLNQA